MRRLTWTLAALVAAAAAVTARGGTWEYDFTKATKTALVKDWKVVAGKFEVTDGTLFSNDVSADDNNAFRAIAQTMWDLGDGTIEAKVKHDDKAAGLNDCLVFYRMKNDDDGYASRLQLDSYITIGKITAGRHGHIKFVNFPVVAGEWYTVKVELKGKDIAAFVNNKEYVAVSDDWSSKGKVGFGMARSAGGSRLQWIRVTGDGVTGLSVQPNGKTAVTWGELKSL